MSKFFLAASTASICLAGILPAVEYGNFDIIQLNNSNAGLTDPDPAVSISVAPGSSANFDFRGANRGDIDVSFGSPDEAFKGVMITAVRENGRDNSAAGDVAKTEFATAHGALNGGDSAGRFFIPVSVSPGGGEWNINVAASYFPFAEGWLAGYTQNSSNTNGGVQDILVAQSGMSIGTHFTDDGGGNYTVDLSGLSSFGVPASAQTGVLLVTGFKNEDNYALSSDNPDGTFSLQTKDNGSDGASTERDPIAFAYVPTAAAGPDLVNAVGRIQSDGSSEVAGGNFTVTKLVETFTPVDTTAATTELEFDITVADASGIEVGQQVTGDGIPENTTVAAVDGTTVTINQAATSTASGVAVSFVFPPTQGRWLLEIPGQSVSTGTLIVSPCSGGGNNIDNIVTYEWDGALGVNGGWVIESRDLNSPTELPLEDGATPDEDMFSFVFFTTSPTNSQPTVSITAPTPGADIPVGNSVTITADANDAAPGSVASVEFYLDDVLVFTDTTAPYEYTTPVYNEAQGFVVEAVVQDSDGARIVSQPIGFSIVPPAGNGGLYFNGVDEYADLGNPPALNLSTFTLETWVKREGNGIATSTGSGGVTAIPLVTKGRGEADQSNLDLNYFMGIRESDGVLIADFEDSNLGNNVPVAGVTPIPLGEWHHVAATFDGTSWSLYLNGNLEATLNAGGLVPRADSLHPAALASALNSTSTPDGFFNGYLDEVRIWNFARTQSQIRASIDFELTFEPGLVARWGMTEGSGTTITSSATGGLVGGLVNSPTWVEGQAYSQNATPSVAMSSPGDGDRFLVGETIPLAASASDSDGSIQQVEFFDNGVSIGIDTTAPFELAYSSAPLGGYHQLTAVATDQQGSSSVSEAVTVDVTLQMPSIPGYSAGVVDGGDGDIDDDAVPADPANWVISPTTQSPLAFDMPGTDVGDLAININGSAVAFDSGIVLASNYSTIGNLASTDSSLATYRGDNGEYFLSSMDNEDPGATEPLSFEESSRFSLGYFPFADGWVGANLDFDGTVLNSSSNLPPSVSITNPSEGRYLISGLPTSGNLIPIGGGDGYDNVPSVGQENANWVIQSRDNSQAYENEKFGFVYIPETSRQVFSGRVLQDGTLVSLNDELTQVGASSNLGTQGYELIIGDGTIINPSNSAMFITADIDAGPGEDNLLSYSAAGDVFVVFSQDLPGLSGQFQSSGFRFVIVPLDPVAIHGDEVVVVATDSRAEENSADTMEFTFTRSGSTANPLTVGYTVGGTATNGVDYDTLSGSVTFGAGNAAVTLTVAAAGDLELELEETLSISLSPGSGYTVGRFSTATGTILNANPLIPLTTVSFQEGTDGYSGQFDKRVGVGVNELGSTVTDYYLDGRPSHASSPDINGLVRFDNLFGDGPGQIPIGAEVTDARLFITTSTAASADSGGPWIIDRLLIPFDETTTYEDLGGDPDPNTYDGFEGARGASTGLPVAGFGTLSHGDVGEADVTELVQAWADGDPNYGFSIVTGGTTDGWSYNTVGNPNPVLRPRLQITYTSLAVKEYFYESDKSAVVNSQTAIQDGNLVESVFFDLNDGTTGTTEGLLRFPVTFGAGGQDIPIGEEVVKAELLIVTNSPIFLGSGNAQTGGNYAIHQMISDWSVDGPEPTNFGNLGPIVGTHIEPAAARFSGMGWSSTAYVDVTELVRNWRAGADNFGMNVKPETGDGWQPFFPGVAFNSQLSLATPMLRVQTAIITPSSFDTWASANGIPGSNFNEDHDKDGLIELVEYALGLDPKAPSTLPGLGPDMTLSFTKGADAGDDPAVSYEIEVSSNLIDWDPIDETVNDASAISAQLPADGGKVFGRLKVDYNP